MDILGDPTGEAAFISRMFEKDAKNYHVWSYRQWLVRRFDLWEDELPDIEVLLKKDVRNNSAWNHRWFVVFGRGTTVGKDVVDREIEYAKRSISEAPQNQSPWNYLRGVLRKANRPPSDLGCFAEEFAPLDKPDEVRSSHALDFLADMYGENGKEKDKASAALDLLAYRYDPIRANYWNYRKSLLAEASGTA
ncbi:MAG: CAAX geranylgeranyltransferase alpha subunit [Pycnora praestabilis]|nr:MAG: CAAX geranylgeranyltransferase alpha subunit [Pycnora praestabilis]